MTDINLSGIIATLCDDLQYCDQTCKSYILSRLNNEGISFLTITLPLLEGEILASLESGRFNNVHITQFKHKGKLLHHFYGWLRLIYNSDGSLRADLDEVALYGLLQLTGYAKKVSLQYPDETLFDEESAFVSHDLSLDSVNEAYFKEKTFSSKLRSLVTRTFQTYPCSMDKVLKECPPRFGPGTFSSDLNRKVKFQTSFMKSFSDIIRIPAYYKGICGYFFQDKKSFLFRNKFKFIERDTSTYSELLFVPKTAKGPRTIVREPLYRLAVQMSFFDYTSTFLQRRTHGRIQFTDQTRNRNLAKEASLNGKYATLDLSKASDSVSYKIIHNLLGHIPGVSTFITKFRSTHVRLPSGGIHALRKLAGMGSGLTFPLLALLCHHSVAAGVALRFPNLDINHILSEISVYGDDLIVPTDWVPVAVLSLAKVGLTLNGSKSFTTTHNNIRFRESCGGNYLNGEDVTVKRLRLSSLNKFNEVFFKDLIKNGKSSLKHYGVRDHLDLFPVIFQLERHCRELVYDGFRSLANQYYDLIDHYLFSLSVVWHRSSLRNFSGLPVKNGYFPGMCRVDPAYQPQTDSEGNYVVTKAFALGTHNMIAPEYEMYHYSGKLHSLQEGISGPTRENMLGLIASGEKKTFDEFIDYDDIIDVPYDLSFTERGLFTPKYISISDITCLQP